ncbi:MAG: hypothetical protein AAF658_18465, partial [Myxococcota bacterium]
MSDSEEDFFVGYLQSPPRLTRFSIAVGSVVLLLGLGVGVLAATFQRSPGAALERTEWGVELVGTLYGKPYPHLLVQTDDGMEQVLLARGGKNGTPSVGPDREGRVHAVKGAAFHRDGRTLLEMYGMEPRDGTPIVAPAMRKTESVTLNGVIVDSKCYYGRMKPGAGQAHRACAQYCVWSGIPPVLVVYENGQATEHYLVTMADG